jgi:hypothetical protein
MARSWGSMADFIEDMRTLRSAGYTTKKDYADRLGVTLACFDQRMVRARKRGLLPPAHIGGYVFDPFGDFYGKV